ncbi:TPA: polysaccharide biosynthesis tyrosine autokinase [Candidatus Poribacteria bacterium]|nr:polysaccharide biosynthesis tyrosine autokinase [Candidatus Poribacteria bacterium]
MNKNNNYQNPDNDYQQELGEPEIHLRDYLYVILVRKWFVLLGFMAVLFATIYYIVTTTPTYEAKVELLYEKYRSTPILIQGLEVSTNPSSLQLEAQKRILRSPLIVQEVALRFNALDPDYNLTLEEIAKNLDISSPPKADNVLELSATADSPQKAAALANIATDVYIAKVNERKNSDLDRAITFLERQKNTLDEMLQKDEQDLNQFREREGIILSSKEGSKLGFSLLSQLGRLQQDVLDVQMERDLAEIQLTTVQGLIAEKKEKMDADTQVALLTGGGMSQIESLQSKIVDMQLELDAMKEEKSQKHPDVIDLEQKIKAANARLDAEFSKLIEKQDLGSFNLISEWQNLIKQSVDLTVKIKSLDGKEKLLQSRVDQFRESHPELVETEVELMRLERQKRIHEETYSFLMNRYEETRLLKQMQTSDFTIITNAKEPKSPIKPKKRLTLALGVVLGLMLGLGAAFFIEYMDDSLRRKEDIERWLNVPVIGMVPRIAPVHPSSLPSPTKVSQSPQPPLIKGEEFTVDFDTSSATQSKDNVLHNPSNLPKRIGDDNNDINQSKDNSEDRATNLNSSRFIGTATKRRKKRRSQSHLKKSSELLARSLIYNKAKDITESYRSLAANIQFANVDKPVKVVLITSPTPAEGKTLTAGNLAITMARSDKKTLLVDCDFRRPAQHRLFAQPREPGLSDYLIATPVEHPDEVGEETSEIIHGLIRETEVDNLSLVTCGQIPPNPIPLLASERMKGLIEKWREEYDIVLFDSPPLLSVADASILASEVDTVITVVQAGQTKRQSAQHAMEMLEKMGQESFGVILNNIDFSKHYGSHYYYYYYYPRKYYSSEEEDEE